jgi:FkbM family methyltransferase
MLLEQLLLNVQDAFQLGFFFPMRHLAAAFGARDYHANVRGAGALVIRSHTSDASVVRQVFAAKDYDMHRFAHFDAVERVYNTILESGRTPLIIDAGANIGASTVWFARQYPKAQVVAVEPEPANAAICRENIRELPNARLVEAAIGGAPGHVALSNSAESWAFQTKREETGGVDVVTISDLLAAAPNSQAFIIKIDIEGFEADVFSANLGWLDQAEVVIVEPHDWMLPGQGTSRTMQAAMAARPFEMLLSGENVIYVRMPEAAA